MPTELAFTSFLSISVPPRVCAEKYLNKIRSQKLDSNVGAIRWFWQVMCLQWPEGCVWYRQSILQSDPANFKKLGSPSTAKLNRFLEWNLFLVVFFYFTETLQGPSVGVFRLLQLQDLFQVCLGWSQTLFRERAKDRNLQNLTRCSESALKIRPKH